MDAEFFGRPVFKRVVKISGGIGKGGEDEDFAVGLLQLVGGGFFDFVFDKLLKLFELGVSLNRHVFGSQVEKIELSFVLRQVFEPAVDFEMCQLVFELRKCNKTTDSVYCFAGRIV